MKILIIGFGSIGQKHYKNLIGHDVWVFDTDQEKTKGFKAVDDLSSLSQFDAVFICNPTNLHIETALLCAKAGCNLFIEKPLSDNLEGIDELIRICKEKNLVTMVGCNLRFDSYIKKMKEMTKDLGKVYAIYLEYGRYLPEQRETDYRKVYASSQKMGGGIILDDIHSFDLAFWFNNFHKLKDIKIVSGKISDLEIDVEDISNAILVFDNKVIANIRSDYLQKYKHRNCKIIGEKGNLVWNFRENKLYFEAKEKKEIEVKPNDSFLDEVKYFLKKVEEKKETFNNLEISLKVLKQILNEKSDLYTS